MIKPALCLILWAASLPSQALGLLDAYALALRNDPLFQAAIREHSAGQEERNIARAGLLPKLSYSYNGARNQSEVTQATADGSTTTDRDYRSYHSQLSLQQPLFDYAAWVGYRQGITRALMADQRLRGRSQELATRLFTAYSQALLNAEYLALAQARRRTHEAQLHANRRLLKGGDGTRTDALESQARASLAHAEAIEAQDDLDAALQTVQAILGEPLSAADLAPLAEPFEIPSQPTLDFEHWRDLALRDNPELAGLGHALALTEQEIQRQRAGHLPTLGLYANSRTTRSDSENSYNQQYDTHTLGLQLHVPLYAGGGVAAATRKANAAHEQSSFELDASRLLLVNQLRQQYNRSVSAQARIRALEIASASAILLIEATRKSMAGGERVNLDVLNAEHQRYSVQRDLAEARHAYLQAWLQLRALSGQLQIADLEVLDGFFTPRVASLDQG
jgi:protease secretion system outer membrane protein